MENATRKSNRSVKPRIEEGFDYDESLNFISKGGSSGTSQCQVVSAINECDIPTTKPGKSKISSLTWADLNLPICDLVPKLELDQIRKEATRLLNTPIVEEQEQEQEGIEDEVFVNKPGTARTSSTRGDYLSDIDCFLSASPINTSDMPSDSDVGSTVSKQGTCGDCVQGKCEKNHKGAEHGAKLDTSTDQMFNALFEAVGKINTLSNTVQRLEKLVVSQNVMINAQGERIKRMEESGQESGRDRSPEGAKGGLRTPISKKGGYSSFNKKSLLDEDRARSLRVIQDQIEFENKIISESDLESQGSEDGVNAKNVKKKMSRKQRDRCSSKVSNRLRMTGATFPEDDFLDPDSSGKESDNGVCNHSKKVKSGSKIKVRPVLRTELWPHTVINEEDGDDVDSESIGLYKFFKGFSAIMMECEGMQSQGRKTLQKAIFSVLECLPWAEGRAFHNSTMLKIEQGRIGWDEDFEALADTFIERKVRAGLRTKHGASGSSYRPNYNNRGAGRGYRNQRGSYNNYSNGQNNGNTSGRGNPLLKAICWQWNSGSCSFGTDCKRWHCCRTCADSGKLGEKHPASSHNSQGSNSRDDQRV